MTKLVSNHSNIQARRYSKLTQRESAKSSLRLASGSRINQAADDAAGLSIATNLNSKTRSKQQAVRNSNDAHNILQTMDGVLNEMGSMIIRMRELAIGAASDTYSDIERAMMQNELSQTSHEMNRIANSTDYLDHKLLVGNDKKLQIQVNTNNGEKNRINIDLKDMAQTTYALGIADINIETQHRATISLAKIDYAQNEISHSRAKIGGISSSLESNIQKLNVDVENEKASHSRIKDADVAEETAASLKNKILQDAQTSAMVQTTNMGRDYLKLI